MRLTPHKRSQTGWSNCARYPRSITYRGCGLFLSQWNRRLSPAPPGFSSRRTGGNVPTLTCSPTCLHLQLQRSRLPAGGALALIAHAEEVWAPTQWIQWVWGFLPHSHSFFSEPHILIISLNMSHHLTHQTVALPTDSIHAKKRKAH